MNIITCDEECRHNKDGYCSLNHISRLTNTSALSGAKCGYFKAAPKTANAARNQSPETNSSRGIT